MIDMRIDQYHITSDQRNVIVSVKGPKAKVEATMGYYNSLPLAFQEIARDMLQNGEGAITSVDAYADKAQTIETTLAAAAREYGQKIQEATR